MRDPLTIQGVADLAAWPTKRLIGRLRKLRACEEAPEASDLSADELAELTGIYFKSDPEWRDAYRDVKRILECREHIPSGKEQRARRQERASKEDRSRGRR